MVAALATLCALLWGSAVPGVKAGYALLDLAPGDTLSLVLFAGIRFTLAGLLLLAYAAATGKAVVGTRRDLGRVALLGLISTTVQYIFYYIGIAHSTGVKVSITTSTSTFFSVILAHFIYTNDRLSTRRIVGCLIGFAGVVIVNIASTGFDLNISLLGEGFIIVAAIMFSFAGIYGKRVSRQMDVTVMTGWQLALGGAVMSAIGLGGGGHLGSIGPEAVLLLGYLAVLSATAFALWSLLLKHNPVGTVAIFNCLIPLFGVTLSALFLGENIFEWKNLVALLLVVTGIVLVTQSAARRDPALTASPP